MEVQITTFRNPFSFFCLPAEGAALANVKDIDLLQNNCGYFSKKFDLSGVVHGQVRNKLFQYTYLYVWI